MLIAANELQSAVRGWSKVAGINELRECRVMLSFGAIEKLVFCLLQLRCYSNRGISVDVWFEKSRSKKFSENFPVAGVR